MLPVLSGIIVVVGSGEWGCGIILMYSRGKWGPNTKVGSGNFQVKIRRRGLRKTERTIYTWSCSGLLKIQVRWIISLHGDWTGSFYEPIYCRRIYLERRGYLGGCSFSLNLSGSRKWLQVSKFISDRTNFLAPSHMFVETPCILVCLAITTFPVKPLKFELHGLLQICWTTRHWYAHWVKFSFAFVEKSIF